jgi:hypothetical protein
MAAVDNTVFVAHSVRPNPPSADFTNTPAVTLKEYI